MDGNRGLFFEAQRVLVDKWTKQMAHITLIRKGAPRDGGIGSVGVFEAEGLPDGCPQSFALKWVKQDSNGELDPKKRERMIEREYKDTANAHGEHHIFPTAYAYGLYSDESFGIYEEPAFIMQDLSGYDTLYSWMNKRGHLHNSVRFTRIPVRDVARFGLRLLEGMEALWTECDLVHGDLSCSNVMLNAGAETLADVVKSDTGFYVIDFGQAKRGFRTATQVRAGTAPFSPLEIDCRDGLDVTGKNVRSGIGQYYDQRNQPTVDLWSIGALLFFMRTGALPPGPDGCALDCSLCDPGVRGCAGYEFRFCDERKQDGIRLPLGDGPTSDQERALHDAIAVCTKFNPEERERDTVKALLTEAAAEIAPPRTALSVDRAAPGSHFAAQQERGSSALGPSHTPPYIIPAQDEPEPMTHTVFAQAYKMYDESGEEYSEYDSDILVIGATEESCAVRRRKLNGKHYSLKRAGDLVELSDRGNSFLRKTADGGFMVPWKSIEVAFIRTTIYPNLMFAWFFGCGRLEQVIGLERIQTQSVEIIAGLFCRCSSLRSLDLSGFDTSKVTDMSIMFASCASLTHLDLSGFDTSKVTSMELMFANCTSLTSLDLSSFDTSKVTTMKDMFGNCQKLEKLGYSPAFRLCDGMTVEDVFGGSALEPFVTLSGCHALILPIDMRINPSDEPEFTLDMNDASNEKMVLIKADGTSREAEVVLCFQLEKYDGQGYVIYSFGEVDDEGNETLHCSQLNWNWDNDTFTLDGIPHDEWKDVQEVMQSIIEHEED